MIGADDFQGRPGGQNSFIFKAAKQAVQKFQIMFNAFEVFFFSNI